MAHEKQLTSNEVGDPLSCPQALIETSLRFIDHHNASSDTRLQMTMVALPWRRFGLAYASPPSTHNEALANPQNYVPFELSPSCSQERPLFPSEWHQLALLVRLAPLPPNPHIKRTFATPEHPPITHKNASQSKDTAKTRDHNALKRRMRGPNCLAFYAAPESSHNPPIAHDSSPSSTS